ncbi:hypothetical protein QQP08_001543 [Theobroma cacao]|nr:hypothetical protein QQP08_001543 [Theobroma cacao]
MNLMYMGDLNVNICVSLLGFLEGYFGLCREEKERRKEREELDHFFTPFLLESRKSEAAKKFQIFDKIRVKALTKGIVAFGHLYLCRKDCWFLASKESALLVFC